MTPEWSTACPDWEARIMAGQSLVPFAPLFPGGAQRALEVFNVLRMVDAPGQPTMGEVSKQWVLDFVSAIFGSYDADTGRRLISDYMLLISKKNGKSTDAAAIMLVALILNWRQSGEFLILAPTVEIANNSFGPARDMIRADEELLAIFNIQEHVRTITHRANGSTLKVVAADSSSVGGKKAIGVLIDELWLFGKDPNAENMLREATGGLASRPEGFTIYLSTQSDTPPAGVFAQQLHYARDVRDGVIVDKRFLPVLYEFPKKIIDAKGYRDRKMFFVTNPNLGASVDVDFLDHELKKAERKGEASLRSFFAKHLNVEIGLALRGDRWAGADYWERNADRSVTLEELLDRCEVVTVGIDGGGLDDLLGVAVLGRVPLPEGQQEGTKKWLLWSHAFCHRSVLDRHRQEAARLQDFIDDGDLELVGPGEDVERVADVVEQCEASGLLDRIGVDQAGIGDVPEAIMARGLNLDRIVGISQGWKLQGSIKTAERRLEGNSLAHGGTRLMNFAVSNAKCEARGNAIVITKQGSGSLKIDPLLAMLDAVAVMAMDPKPRKKSQALFFV